MALKEISQADFSGGVNAVTNPFVVTDKQVVRLRNLLLDEHGALSTRPGYSVLQTSNDTTNPIVYIGALNTTDGTVRPFHIQNDGSTNTVYRSDTGAVIGATTTGFTPPQSVTVLNQEVIASGYETPWTWDGTTFARMTAGAGQTVPPGARHLAFHLSQLWVFNTAAATTTLDGASSLRASDVNNVNSWPNAFQTFIARDDGQVGMGIGVYTIAETGISPTTTLIAFKNRSAYQVTGTFSGTGVITVQKLKSDMGCIAPRTIQFVSGFGLIRLTHKGFALFNGVDDRLISEEVRPYIFGRDDISALSFTYIERAVATQVSNPPLYICACPTTAPPLDRVFVYDLVRRAWSICDFPIAFNALTLFTSQTAVLPDIRAGRSSSGQIVRLFNSADTSDAGAGVTWGFTTKNFGSPVRPSYWRRVTLDMRYTPPQSVTVQTSVDGSSAVSQTLSFRGSAGSLYGTATYGTGTYGLGVQDAAETADVMRTGTWANSTVSGTGNVRIRGISYHASPKPVTRLASAGAL